MPLRSVRRLAFLVTLLLGFAPAQAADIHVMISSGFFHVYSQLGPQFEKATSHHLITTRGPSLGDSPEAIPTRLARGEAEIGFQQVAELIHTPDVDVVRTVPAEIQPPTYFVGELTAHAKQSEAAIALLKFLSSAEAAPVITKAGLKPLAR